ncbi:uncharacterized protein DUF3231 [Cytobacillus oceanisediminis]|jgi:hypothetical protein|uniref:Uncharacterized protein DUF3231 n=1 Tax=Cytobacillus oceanisediminis TaxID=665099 RepID=A0A2V2ZGS6_9BACI|nr:uncharacterized protein DUF3231 [Cytobacillus oceanisediminis]
MDEYKLKLTSSEIGTLWGEYVNGTMTDVVNRYMVSIIEDEQIKAIFEDAIKMFSKQKQQIVTFLENEGFPVFQLDLLNPTSLKGNRDCSQIYLTELFTYYDLTWFTGA